MAYYTQGSGRGSSYVHLIEPLSMRVKQTLDRDEECESLKSSLDAPAICSSSLSGEQASQVVYVPDQWALPPDGAGGVAVGFGLAAV